MPTFPKTISLGQLDKLRGWSTSVFADGRRINNINNSDWSGSGKKGDRVYNIDQKSADEMRIKLAAIRNAVDELEAFYGVKSVVNDDLGFENLAV